MLSTYCRVRLSTAFVLLIGMFTLACMHRNTTPAAVNPVGLDLKLFSERARDYKDLQRKLQADLPKLSEKATPEQIKAHRDMLAAKVREARASAQPGDLFIPSVQDEFRRFIRAQLNNPDGLKTLRTIKETPASVKLQVNGDYPQEAPVTTMPPSVLKQLPVLPEDIEYRFIGRDLILRDTHAELVIDFMRGVLPAPGRASR